MKRAFQLGKWIYSGLLGMALALAGLSSHVRAPWNNSTAVARLEAEQNAGKKISVKKDEEKIVAAPSPYSSLDRAQAELKEALTWNELRSFPSAAYKDLVQQLAQEEFENGHPFMLPEQRAIWVEVLRYGLKDYSRKIYRSPHFQGPAGYDLISYELLLDNGQKAHLLAYREKTEGLKMVVGGRDQRPTRIDLYTQISAEPDSGWNLQSFRANGEKTMDIHLDQRQFLASKEAIVSLSVPLLTAGR
jgi:hypothetical protein